MDINDLGFAAKFSALNLGQSLINGDNFVWLHGQGVKQIEFARREFGRFTGQGDGVGFGADRQGANGDVLGWNGRFSFKPPQHYRYPGRIKSTLNGLVM